jgi:hypothetical protein
MIALAISLALLAAPHPAGSVVLGVSTIEGTETEILVVTPRGEREVLGTLTHARGHIPKGILAGDRVLTVARVPDDAGGVLEETLLSTGARRVLLTNVLATQAPSLDDTQRVLAVRQDAERTFSIVRADDAKTLARVTASWLTPARGSPGAFLVIDGARTRLSILAERGLEDTVVLGEGPVRSAVLTRAGFAIERARAGGRADLVMAGRSQAAKHDVVRAGLAGMDPLPCGEDIVVGSGEKHATLLLLRRVGDTHVKRARLTADRAGVATPRACAMVDGAVVAVAWLDRGAALPGELWRFTPAGASALLAPQTGAAVEVYGVIGGSSEVAP